MQMQNKTIQALKKFVATLLVAVTLMGACAPLTQSQAATSTTQSADSYKLDKKFTVKFGKTVTIPNAVSIKFIESRLWDTKEVSFDIEVTSKGKETSKETLVYNPSGEQWCNIAYYNGYKIEVLKAVHQTSATLIVTKSKQRKASTMTGKCDKYYTTKNNEYFEEDRFVLYVPKGITLRQDTVVMINEILDLLEEKTGWKFFDCPLFDNDPVYGPTHSSYGYEEDFYWFVDPERKKIQIRVVEDFDKVGYVSWAAENTFCYVYSKEFDNNMLSLNTVAHELAHVLNSYNIPMATDSDTFTEGFAHALAYEITEELNDKYPDAYLNYIITEHIEENPDGSPSPITKSSAQELFEHNYRLDPDERMEQRNYQIGGALNLYILEKYGANGYIKLKKQMNKKGFKSMDMNTRWSDPKYKDPTIKDYSNALKAVFGKNFFKNFATWFKANKERLLVNWYK